MMNKLPCYIVRDLLPMYADELLSPESEKDLRTHLDECEECSTLYKQMTSPEPEIASDVQEVDYLKKINKGRKRILTTAILIVALVACGALINARIQAAKADISYDDTTKTMIIYGKDDTDLKLPETVDDASSLDAQFDSLHLKVQLSLLNPGEETRRDYLPEYLGRTNDSIKFIKNYLKENCPDIDLADRADKYVDISIMPNEDYSWKEVEDRIELRIGSYYWHREELYILSLLGDESAEWKQIGYAWYLGSCIDPYNEMIHQPFTDNIGDALYYDAYLKGGGTDEPSAENYKILFDAVSYHCLTEAGMHWGTPYESWPITETGIYGGPKYKQIDPGNKMSVAMATSFIAYLSDQYGFDKVSKFCFENVAFGDVFGTDWQSAYDEWSQWIIETYGK